MYQYQYHSIQTLRPPSCPSSLASLTAAVSTAKLPFSWSIITSSTELRAGSNFFLFFIFW